MARTKRMKIIVEAAPVSEAEAAKRYAKLYLLLKGIEARSAGKAAKSDADASMPIEDIEAEVSRQIAACAAEDAIEPEEAPGSDAEAAQMPTDSWEADWSF